jgi:hypothetical protein
MLNLFITLSQLTLSHIIYIYLYLLFHLCFYYFTPFNSFKYTLQHLSILILFLSYKYLFTLIYLLPLFLSHSAIFPLLSIHTLIYFTFLSYKYLPLQIILSLINIIFLSLRNFAHTTANISIMYFFL